ncbi:Aldehyde dehydrogenase [Labilithrix luteola]|uniref:Aldehyde dehydrogenase n=1 Tax=Labilithrix luteola TaxID=1391654 RepID=A0A0K1Q775_9BACT|nr:aldehyde dehydrogenase family protein [Labilithrix luteola]AKV01512.1 Aldehyde dehydrogenase [Labilithrix luteola]
MADNKKRETIDVAEPAPRANASDILSAQPKTNETSLTKAFTPPPGRVRVNKAYKMFVGGAFVRSESGRYFQVGSTADHEDADPDTVNVPRGSRKDVRDAVLTAKNAQAGWEKRTAYNRGQILYRLAEVMESRRPELTQSLERGGLSTQAAAAEVDAAVDRVVFYAGFADKYFALLASSNPVAGPHFGFSLPEAMGVVGVVAPDRPALLGLVSTVLPVITGGNTVVALASEKDPRTAIVFCECVATSDMPGGVVNVLTGQAKEISGALAKHREVIGIDAWMVDADLRKAVEHEGADNVKRVKTHVPMDPEAWLDERRGQGLGWIERFLETKTIWHPVGL